MLQEIREKLQRILKDEPDNYSKIIELANELAKFDKDTVRFSIDAGIIDRLGKELVGRHETAVAELVKNGYDADAKQVDLNFFNGENSQLIIEDDGEGMTRELLINSFMRISSSNKQHNPTSNKYQRQKAGRKGIGRFATQRLGDKLTIITQTNNSSKALQLTIYWKQFERDTDLNQIESWNDPKFVDTL